MTAETILVLLIAVGGFVVGSLWLRSITSVPDDRDPLWRYRDR